ncbi:CBM96 family carbohydrate-binding protein [Dactylosporangium sp. CA-092794]|uniref:CBM96 family carbohydrate-binding protein n=1 Tax=Dactylosporangium sp. CA-092794 TaxID=3239929 RepID=UPI003D92493D
MIRRHARAIMPIAALAIGAGFGTTAFSGTAAAATTDVVRSGAADDSYSSSARPSYNFGASDTLVAGRQGTDTMISFLKFNVAGLGTGVTVKNAKVTLTNASRTLPGSISLSRVADAKWSEQTLSAKNDPALGAVVATVKPASGATSVTFDVSGVVKGAGTYTFAVTSTAANSLARFSSAEAKSGQPALNLTVTRPAAPAPAPTTPAPTTPAPTTPAPTTPAPTTPAPTTPSDCAVGAKLVPTCGVLWGAAAGGFSDVPRDEALKTFEAKSGRTSTIYHTYHKGDELFPTKDEIAMTNDPAHPRTLMLNWKVSYGTTWAKVAAGSQDARIDRLATYLKANYTKQFFMVLHHEPENDVNPAAGSGQTAKDFAAMFRHTALRLKADGVNNAVFVIAYMNYEKWNNTAWWGDLYPGDDVVDWVGVDTYNNAQPGGFHYGDFNYLMNRTNSASFPGWYTWATTKHPAKPIMVAEWGVYDSSTKVDGRNKANVYATVLPQLAKMPQIKGLVYFETAHDQSGHDIRIDDTPEALAGFQKIAADPRFNVKL